MRELGFRAYIKPLKRYATGIDTIQFHKCCDVAGAGIWSVVTANEGIFDFDDIIIEQSTGLKDKNGKEIYEGDIVKIRHYGKAVVFWNERGCGFWTNLCDKDNYHLTEMPLYTEDYKEYSVIGNIHENPELIEEE